MTSWIAHPIVAALMAIAVAAIPAAAQEPTPVPSACIPPAAGEPRVISGNAQMQSAPFTLDGGAYRVDWTMAQPSTQLSFIRMESVDDPSVLRSETILNASGAPGAAAGQTYIYKVKPGPYYLSVRAPSGWTVTLTPIAP